MPPKDAKNEKNRFCPFLSVFLDHRGPSRTQILTKKAYFSEKNIFL
jgi:hypothetical protein